MNRDRARDILLATSDPPDHIHCLVCRAKMKVVGKELDEAPAGNQDRVIFFFECLMGCRTRRAFFSTGVELRPKAHLCPKCRHQLKIETVRGSDGLTMTETCPGCGYTDTIRFDLKVPEPQPDPAFVADRQRFCLTDEQGREYLKDKADQDLTNDLAKMREANNALKQMADRIAKIKILTVGDLERRLVALLEKHGYGQLNFNAPDVGKFFIVPFTLRDITKGRKESDAIAEVQKLLKSDLAPSNWRLMTDGIYSQLGILVGRLRGYERESELAELLGESKRKSKQVKS